MKIRWTLFLKVQILVISILLISYIAVELIILSLIGGQMQERFIVSAKNSVVLMQGNIETIFADTEERLEYLGFLLKESDMHSELTSSYIGALGLSNSYGLNTFVAYEDGSWDIMPINNSIPSDFNPRERAWYKRSFKKSGVKWSEPYEDASTNIQVITGSLYVELADSIGVAGMDISLSKLTEIFKDIDISQNDVVVLLNDSGLIIASNSDYYIENNLEVFADKELMSRQIITGELETQKGLYYMRKLDQSNMRLMIFLPREDIDGTTRQAQLIMTLVISIILIVSVILSHHITRRVMRPLIALKDVMIMSRGRGELIHYGDNGGEEISAVIKAYNGLADYVNRQNDEITRLAYEDDLTGLPNRASFVKVAKQSFAEDHRVALFYFDLDNFKYVNDTYGHVYGDKVLEKLAESLKAFSQKQYFVARLSGDEFGIVVSEYEDNEELDKIAQRLIHLMQEPIFIENIEFKMTGSLGLSCFPEDGDDYETILSNADIAMYEAKGKLTTHFVRYDEDIRSAYMEQLRIESRLISSIENGEFAVVYQPILNLKSKEVSGFEALARWTDERKGPISPDVFIPIAEKNQFINVIGAHVLEQSIVLGRRLFEKYGKYFELNVNVSVVQLQRERYVEEVLEILDQYKYPSRFLNLEITESLTLESDDQVLMKLAYLRKKGISISIDDFGTGYSSLNHMTDLSLTHVKIDRMLIIKAYQSKEVFYLIKGIIEFAHTMMYKVVAEGIEDDQMEAMVSDMNSDYVQGYKYAKPMYIEQLLSYIDEGKK